MSGSDTRTPGTTIQPPRSSCSRATSPLADGIHLFHTPGHTVGHYSLLVELQDSHPLLFMADVSYTVAAFAADQQAGFHNNPVDGVRSIRRCKRLAKEWGAEVIYTHDMGIFQTYPLAPEPFFGSRPGSTAGGAA